MKTNLYLVLCLLLLAIWTNKAFAQSDVCCVMGKKSGGSAETMATVQSPSECKSGGATGDYKVCAAKSDPNNECSMMGERERCSACGYFWAGKACLAEDPVKKAKEELKKEEEQKKKKEAAKPSTTAK